MVIFMSYVFFDLEWNQGYPHGEDDKLDEIIQIGACRLDSWEGEIAPFSSYVRPAIHKKLHHRVRKMLPLSMDTLRRAESFRTVARRFFAGAAPTRCSSPGATATCGCWTEPVLVRQEEFWSWRSYDLQRAFDLLVLHTDQQAALKDAVEVLDLPGT